METDAGVTQSDPAPEESMVPVFSSSNRDSESESAIVKGILDANGVPCVLVGPQTMPNLEVQVRVPEHMLREARRLLAEAREAGPDAALEAEKISEEG